MKVFFNGRIVDESEALIPFRDRGVLFGDGLFETVRAYKGMPFRLDHHLERLREGCRVLGISGLPGDRMIIDAISELYQLTVGEGDAYIRITLTGGLYDGSRTLKRPAAPNILIVVTPYEGYPRRFYEEGMCMIVSGVRRNDGSPLSRIKSNNYMDTIIAKQEAVDRGADDAVMLNGKGYLAEGTTSNIFLVIEGGVATPDIDCGLLPGITREAVIELCARTDLPCKTGRFTLDDLMSADEAFLSVSTGEIVPIARVEDTTIGAECPGPITTRLSRAYRGLVREELELP
jgi:branched-chain amino acid aminotransferase